MKIKKLYIVGLGLAICMPASGQIPRTSPLPIEDVIGAREFAQSVTPVKFSPDGKWIAYTVANNQRRIVTGSYQEFYVRRGVPYFAIGGDICVVNSRNGETKNLTGGKGNNWAPVWSPDGRHLTFLSDRDDSGQAKIWLWEAPTGNLKKVSDTAVRTAEDIQWLPNSEGVLVTVIPENLSPEEHAKRVLGRKSLDTDQARLSVTVYRSESTDQRNTKVPKSDPWSLGGYPVDLVTIDISSGETRRVIRNLDRLGWYVLSPNGVHVAFTTSDHFEQAGSQQILWNLNVNSISTGETYVVAAGIRMGYAGDSFSWSPDSLKLAYRTGGPIELKKDCFVVELSERTPRNVTLFAMGDMQYSPRPPVWDADSKLIYLLRDDSLWRAPVSQGDPVELTHILDNKITELILRGENRLWSPDGGRTTVVLIEDKLGNQSGFFRIDLASGQSTNLMKDKSCHTCMNAIHHIFAAPDGRELAYFSEDAQHDRDLWLTDADFRNRRRQTAINPELDQYQMGAGRSVEWRSLDGDLLHGALLMPAGYQEGKRYPLIVSVYGGAQSTDNLKRFGLGFGGAFNGQLLATRGYAVLFPDAPQHLGTPMADLTKTVLPGVNKLIEMGIADPDRLGVMGQSYGGYCTFALVVQTKRFKAAMVSDGYADLFGHYGEMSDEGTAYGTSIEEGGQGLMGGTPWEFRERYIENSPFFYLNRVETPVLIMHGSRDMNVSPFLDDEVYVGLRRLGKVVEYAKYEGEDHSPVYWSYAHQIDFCNRMISWFEKYVKGSSD
jgi:dipeptidyl aminopeptidase/acylaminoacyl peptidase